jgi:two-component system chemotaxis sensor kinase CheA
VRNERLAITPALIDLILRGADYLKAAIDQVDAALRGKGQTVIADNRDLIAQIRQVVSDEAEPDSLVTEAGGIPRAAPASDQGETPKSAAGTSGVLAEARVIKVDTARLDHLVDMVGEMVIAQSLLRHEPYLLAARSPRVQRTLSQLSGITSDVQKTAMALRMVPVGHLFQRMGRFVRDLSRKAGKQVELVTSGEDTELDRQIVEELADPLMHMVRNSIDHGLEKPGEREAAGKAPTGRVTLAAHHQGGQILIEVGDDGRGLNREKILAKARENGLLASGNHFSDSELFNLIFEPGFSTAERVTDVSGRGVGMDVVKRNITKLRGRVEAVSSSGKGVTFLLKLPLTLAIIDGLVVAVGRERYIVPIYSVLEMLRPARETVSTVQSKGEMVLVRGSLLPIIRLYRRFGVIPRSEDPSQSLLIVAESEGRRFCLMVDEFLGKQEVVIKSLGELLKNTPGVAGGAILGDGRVGLILDLEGIFFNRGGDV